MKVSCSEGFSPRKTLRVSSLLMYSRSGSCRLSSISGKDPEREYISKELTRKVFRGLNPSLQDTFILQKAEGWTSQELAEALGITVSTVKSRVFRARVRLRQQLMALIHPEQVALQG